MVIPIKPTFTVRLYLTMAHTQIEAAQTFMGCTNVVMQPGLVQFTDNTGTACCSSLPFIIIREKE